MTRFLIGLIFISLAGILIYTALPVRYFTQTKQERLFNVWQKDLADLYRAPQFKEIFNKISAVEVHFTDAQVADEFNDFEAPIRAAAEQNGYILKVSITRWIEAKDYGYIIQHELFDQNQEKLHEFGRTYKIGLIF